MQQSDQTASIPDRLFEPHDGFRRSRASIVGELAVFGYAGRFVGFGDGEDEEEGVRGTGDEG